MHGYKPTCVPQVPYLSTSLKAAILLHKISVHHLDRFSTSYINKTCNRKIIILSSICLLLNALSSSLNFFKKTSSSQQIINFIYTNYIPKRTIREIKKHHPRLQLNIQSLILIYLSINRKKKTSICTILMSLITVYT